MYGDIRTPYSEYSSIMSCAFECTPSTRVLRGYKIIHACFALFHHCIFVKFKLSRFVENGVGFVDDTPIVAVTETSKKHYHYQ
jgi:hypothetical protein